MNKQPDGTIGRVSYVEFSAHQYRKTKSFYQEGFGWNLVDFGSTYAATVSGDVDVGLQGDLAEGQKPPLPVIQVGNLEASLERTVAAGAVLVTPIFSFPGGRRFHLRDPSGNEIAVMQPDSAEGDTP
jgi:predicted enzyme related to lactoylglutathione lyase